jgi:hypothetical protein
MMVFFLGPVSAEVITAVVPLAQKPPEKDEPAQRRDDQYVGNAFGAQHEIVQCVDGVSHYYFLRWLSMKPLYSSRRAPQSAGQRKQPISP